MRQAKQHRQFSAFSIRSVVLESRGGAVKKSDRAGIVYSSFRYRICVHQKFSTLSWRLLDGITVDVRGN